MLACWTSDVQQHGLNTSAPPFATRQKEENENWNKAASPAFCGCEASLGKRMTANRVFQAAIIGLFLFSAVLAAMLVLTP
jgi:hypothetical protein